MPVTLIGRVLLMTAAAAVVLLPGVALAQLKAQVPANIRPAWTKGIQPIDAENYWNAVECGKLGGAAPACVFYDTDLCKNDDFTLTFYTPYKQVAYEVWQAVKDGQPAPTPSFAAAQRTRIILGVKAVAGSTNRITALVVRRGGQVIEPSTRTLDGAGGTFYFDFPAFAPTANIVLEFTGQAKNYTCSVDRAVLARFR